MYARTTLLFLWLVAVVGSGCVPAARYGSWQTDYPSRQLFIRGEILANHRYYYLGSATAPDTVIALDNSFTLRSRLWIPVTMSPEKLQAWLGWFRLRAHDGCSQYGGLILTPDHRRAGVWFGQDPVNTVREPAAGVLEIFQPYMGRDCDGGEESEPVPRPRGR